MSKGNTAVKKLMVKDQANRRAEAFGRFKRWSKSDDIGEDGIGMSARIHRNIERCAPPTLTVKERPVYTIGIIATHW
jgi:hypothetical protein